jgi:hypothetical protein
MRSLQHLVLLLGALGLVLLPGACAGAVSVAGANASCVSPYLDDQPPDGAFGGPAPTVGPGDSLEFYGHWYTTTCNDTGGQVPLEPMPAVHLTLTLPTGATKRLGSFEPEGRDMGFSVTVHVPAETPAGTAKLSDDRENPATYRFQIRK